jgi:hypothetical protein
MRSKAAALEIENARLAAENVYLDTLNAKLAHYLAKLKRLKCKPPLWAACSEPTGVG